MVVEGVGVDVEGVGVAVEGVWVWLWRSGNRAPCDAGTVKYYLQGGDYIELRVLMSWSCKDAYR